MYIKASIWDSVARDDIPQIFLQYLFILVCSFWASLSLNIIIIVLQINMHGMEFQFFISLSSSIFILQIISVK